MTNKSLKYKINLVLTFVIAVVAIVLVLSFTPASESELPQVGKAVSHEYTGYAVRETYTIDNEKYDFDHDNDYRTINIDIEDDAIFHKGYISHNEEDWVEFDLSPGGTTYNKWYLNSATATIRLNAYELSNPNTRENYIVIYTCSETDNEWDCHDGWQIVQFNTSVNQSSSCDCQEGERCINSYCLATLPEDAYFLAPDGDDANPGTLNQPWATLQHAIYQAKPGDTVYMRGGVYYHEEGVNGRPGLNKGYSGTSDNWVRFWNYPGERPIFDFADHEVDENGWTGSIGWTEAEYIHLRGFTVRNVFQTPPDFSRTQKPHSEGHGLSCISCGSMIYENIIAHDINGRAFQHWSGSWGEEDALYAVEYGYQDEPVDPVMDIDNTIFINCDAYNVYDIYAATPGNAADGFKGATYYNDGKNTFTWEGCRTWNYSDDGIDPFGSGKRIFRNNWMWPTYNFDGLSEDWDPEANGIKTTAIALLNQYDDKFVIYDRNIAVDGEGTGFISNLGLSMPTRFPANNLVYNNLAYNMGIGFVDTRGTTIEDSSNPQLGKPPATSTYGNNIAFGSPFTDAAGRTYDLSFWYMDIIDYTNSWWMTNGDGSGYWDYNPDFNVTEDDFVSLDPNDLIIPRRSDFTLPDTDFGKLRPDSELIDAGTIIPGHHCDTAGRHPDLDCVEWAGAAPDLGPFEYGLEEEIVCRGETTRFCSWTNGIGVQLRTCVGPGEWSNFGACRFLQCDDGYMPDGDTCVLEPGEWSEELVYNPSFEGSADGWSSIANWGAQEYVAWDVPHEGRFHAYNTGDSSEETYLYQDIDLNEYSTYIDSGRLLISASGWAKNGYASAVKFIFLDENKNVISTPYDSGYVENGEWWEGSITEEAVPAGTKYFRVWGNTYHPFTNIAGHLDDFSAKVMIVNQGQAQPECTSGETQSCSITNGVGEQTRDCVEGSFTSWSDCTVISCDSGYSISGNSCIPPPQGTHTLVQNGVPLADIVVSPDAPGIAQTAADYFQIYINEMSGATLPINNDPDPSYDFHVYIGQSTYTDSLGVTSDGCVDDGFKMVSGEDYLILLGDDELFYDPGYTEEEWDALTGHTWEDHYHMSYDYIHDFSLGDGRGTLNAVYEFMYDQGMRWYYPNDIGTITPQKDDISFNAVNKLVNPDFAVRDFFIYYLGLRFSTYHYGDTYEEKARWLLSLRMNEYPAFPLSHGLNAVTNREETIAAHPEYFALVDGVRLTPYETPYPNQDLCNEGLRLEHIEFIKAMIDIYDVKYINIAPGDGFTHISESSQECLDKATPERPHGALSNYVWNYMNSVAWPIYEEYGDEVKLVGGAYTTYLAPPNVIDDPRGLAPNLIASFATWRTGYANPETEQFYHDAIDEWVALLPSGKIKMADYYLHNGIGSNTQDVPFFHPHLISEDQKYLKGKSIGDFIEVHANSYQWTEEEVPWDIFVASSLNVYVMSRIWWDADQDVDVILEEYYDLYYGPARDEMKAVVEYSEQNAHRANGDPTVISTLRDLTETALAVAQQDSDPVYAQRINELLKLINSRYVGDEMTIDSCMDLNYTNMVYTLSSDVSSEGTCFNVDADGVTLDCAGHTITYSTAGGEDDNAIFNDEFWTYRGDYFIMKNCIIQDGSYGTDSGEAIRLNRADFCLFENNIINTTGHGIYSGTSQFNTYTGNTINSYSGNAFSGTTHSTTPPGYWILIENNTLYSEEGQGLALWYLDNVTVRNNHIESGTAGAFSHYQVTNLIEEGNTIING